MHDLLAAYPARGTSRWMTWMPLAVLAGVMVVALTSTHPLMQLLPWAALIGMLIFMSRRVRMVRDLERQTQRVQELAMLRHQRQALDAGWELLPKVTGSLDLYARITALLAHLLDQMKADEPAIVGYDYLIERLPAEHPASVQLRVHKAIVQLESDHLADADDALRKLRVLQQQPSITPVQAAYHYALLLQSVRTHHYDDAIAMAGGLLDNLRPLGVDAGYGHALLAWSYAAHADRLRQREPEAQETEAAEAARTREKELMSSATQWWSRATLLLPVADLARKHVQLNEFAQRPPIAAATSAAVPPV